MNGWIKLHRKIVTHDLFQEERVFSKFEAWVDLILLANYKDKKVLINNQWILVKRGQHLTSIKKLAERWNWSRGKVKNFLELLKNDSMLTYQVTSKYTLLTVENYGFYQARENENDIPTNNRMTSNRHQNDTNKKVKKDKKGEEGFSGPTLIRGGRYDEHGKINRTPSHYEFFK